MATIPVPARYCRLYWGESVPHREEHFTLVEQAFEMEASECGLVLVDCWDKHYIESHLERTNRIIEERILPAMEACRKAGIAVIHAPSPPTARKYPRWVAYASDVELNPPPGAAPEWPPADVRNRAGEYERFAKPTEEGRAEWLKADGEQRMIVPLIEPTGEDFVVATGDQLHRLLHHRGIVHLLYAGFAANMCVPGRDYGTRAMQRRGYNVILLRDCTTAIEGHETAEGEWLTKASILEHEMIIGHTATSEALVEACQAAG